MNSIVTAPKRCNRCPIVICHQYFPDEACPDYFVFGTCMEDQCSEWSEEKKQCVLASRWNNKEYVRMN
jgi:hypothetical protein